MFLKIVEQHVALRVVTHMDGVPAGFVTSQRVFVHHKTESKRPPLYIYSQIRAHPCVSVSSAVLLPCITDKELIGGYEHGSGGTGKMVRRIIK